MKPLSSHAKEKLASYRRAQALPPEVRARVSKAVAARRQAGDLGIQEAEHHPVVLVRRAGRWWFWGGALATVLGGVLLWSHLDQRRVEPPPASPPSVRPPVSPEKSEPIAPTERTEPAARARATLKVRAVQTRRAPAPRILANEPERPAVAVPDAAISRSTDSESPSGSSLDAEVRLLRAAQDRLDAGETVRALEVLADHALHFPAGELLLMRKVMHMQAQCDLGNVSQAREEAQLFLKQHAHSNHVARVRQICASEKRD